MRQIEQMARGEVPDVFSALQVFDPINVLYLTNHLPPVECWEAFDKIKLAGEAFIAAHPEAKRQLAARVLPLTDPTPDEWEFFERCAKEAERQNPSPPAPEKEEVKPAVKRKRGRKQQDIDKEPRMREKAKELKQLLEQKGLEPVITTSSMEDELNQVVVNFMADWAQERKALQETAGAMVWRFLTDYCGFADSDGCAAKTWQAHVASKIPELFVEKQKKKKK